MCESRKIIVLASLALALNCPALIGTEKRPQEKSIEEYLTAADAGNADAQFQLGKRYWDGLKVAADKKKAVEYYRKAAEQNHPNALAGLGAAYSLGEGVEAKDDRLALEYSKKAAELGSAPGQLNFGAMLISGRGVEKDSAEGLSWISKAAEQGLLQAQLFLAQVYSTGDVGVKIDYAKALHWVREAVKQDEPAALNLYGVLLRDGRGGKRDPETALSYFQRAADRGSFKAYANLGSAYFIGHGVKKDRLVGMSWWYAGERLGDAFCGEMAKRMTIGMDPEEVSKGRRMGEALAQQRLQALQEFGSKN